MYQGFFFIKALAFITTECFSTLPGISLCGEDRDTRDCDRQLTSRQSNREEREKEEPLVGADETRRKPIPDWRGFCLSRVALQLARKSRLILHGDNRTAQTVFSFRFSLPRGERTTR